MTRVEKTLHEDIEAAGGAISFEQFMATALYDAEAGYYTRRIRQVGRRGDFTTSPALSAALGEAIAHWAVTERELLGLGGEWHLIEVGAGTGELAAAMLDALGWWKRRSVHYHIVEVSQPLRQLQKEKLGTQATWHLDITTALVTIGGEGIIFSNELVDAFPCRLVERTDVGWDEVFVSSDGETFHETLRPLEPTEVPPSLDAMETPSGQRCEIHRTYEEWLHKCAEQLDRGSLLTIDYGGTPEEIYHRRSHGTLRSYAHQMRFEGPEIYERLGQQDLTADVNFSALAGWGEQVGLTEISLTNQRGFLQAFLPGFRQRFDSDRTLDFLTDPIGAGEIFKVLHQRKGAPVKSPR